MITSKINPSNSFTGHEQNDLLEFSFMARKLGHPLSGYLAGQKRGGEQVVRLEDAWSKVFNVKHSVAVNSATSGLLAAAFASDLKAGDDFVCPAMTMSATAAAPCFTGAHPTFMDVEDETFSLAYLPGKRKATFVTNLFGHPANLRNIRDYCDKFGGLLIEDNAQSPFATENGRYAGTIGHIGVFSLNIHKPLQCGEGGMICTNDDDLAERMRGFINHGEHENSRHAVHLGLNLRMPELCAVVALTQLLRGVALVNQRIEQAEALIEAVGFISGIRPPVVRAGCNHVYYTIPFLIDRSRHAFCEELKLQGVPIVEQYARPLYHLPALRKYGVNCPVAEDLYAKRLFYIENCAWDFTKAQIKQVGEAFRRAAEKVKL